MTNNDLQSFLLQPIITFRNIQEKKVAAVVIFYFLFLLAFLFFFQNVFPSVYQGFLFRLSFLLIIVLSLIFYYVIKNTYLMENKHYKNIIQHAFAKFSNEELEKKKSEIIQTLESDPIKVKSDRNLEILYRNLKHLNTWS